MTMLLWMLACQTTPTESPELESDTDTDSDTDADTDSDTDADTDTDTDSDTDADTDPVAMGLDITGSYIDNYGFDHVITDTSWDSYGGNTPVTLTQYDNAEQWAIGQNHPNDAFFPDLWSRFDWTVDVQGSLWYCQIRFDAPTEAEARSTTPADPSNPANGGCGGAPWSELIPNP